MSIKTRIAGCLGTLALVLLATGAALGQEGPPPAPVHVGYALEQDMAPYVWVPGTVVSRNVAPIATQVAGQLTWVAEVGDRLEKGQAVARIDDASLQLQLRNDEATIKSLEAQLTYLDQQLERLTRLTEQQVLPANDLEEAQSQHQAVEQELVQAKVGRERTLYELDRTRVKAPFSGEVVRRLQQPGSYSSVGEEVVFLVDTAQVEVQAQAPLSVAPHLSEGMGDAGYVAPHHRGGRSALAHVRDQGGSGQRAFHRRYCGARRPTDRSIAAGSRRAKRCLDPAQ